MANAALLAGAGVAGRGRLNGQAAAAVPGKVVPLKDVAAKAGILYGSDSDVRIPPDSDYARLFIQQCSLYADETTLGSMYPNGGPDSLDSISQRDDANIPFLEKSGIRLTGGHLLWNLHTPKWMDDTQDPLAVEKALVTFIQLIGKRYGANTYSWNVVNEQLNPQEGKPNGLRGTAYQRLFGVNLFDIAANAAKQTAPNVLRVVNDYDLEMDNPRQAARRAAMLDLLDRFKKQGTPVQAVGIQSHIGVGREQDKFNENVFRKFLKEIADRGFQILLTELDVIDLTTGTVAERDERVASMYSRYLNVSLDEPAVTTVVSWGLSDKYTWQVGSYSKNFVRPDGQPQRPLLFDVDLKPKPAYYSVLAAFQNAPKRKNMAL
jgi:endo-1,4-beta-xylanase